MDRNNITDNMLLTEWAQPDVSRLIVLDGALPVIEFGSCMGTEESSQLHGVPLIQSTGQTRCFCNHEQQSLAFTEMHI